MPFGESGRNIDRTIAAVQDCWRLAETTIDHLEPRERTTREQTSSLAAECETVKEIYAAINRNDIPAAMKAFD